MMGKMRCDAMLKRSILPIKRKKGGMILLSRNRKGLAYAGCTSYDGEDAMGCAAMLNRSPIPATMEKGLYAFAIKDLYYPHLYYFPFVRSPAAAIVQMAW